MPGRSGTVVRVAGESGKAWSRADEVRLLVPVVALAVAIVAAIAEPAPLGCLVLVPIPVVPFAWAFVPGVPLPLLTLAVVAPVVAAQRSGDLEPLLFEVSLLAFVVARWSGSLRTAVALGIVAAAAPVATGVIQDPAEVSVGVWLLGIAFPWVIALAVTRQAHLAAQLEARGGSSPSRRWPSGAGSPASSTTWPGTPWPR